MDKKKSERIQYIIILVLALTIAGILLYMIPRRYRMNTEVTYDVDYSQAENPLIGYAPIADNIGLCEKSNLVFLNISWADWEPERGKYAIDALEKKYHIEDWKEKNKHAILRFTCDVPGASDHIDIPQWLYDVTGDGTHYDNACGLGYSPNYENKTFISRHEMAIQALAEYCNKDSFVSFIELGSLGHWGEWHTTDSDGSNIMPDSEICLQYANQYSDNFVNAILMTRRNYDFSVNNGIGVYNDMIGDYKATEEWLSWINEGEEQETSGDSLVLKSKKKVGMMTPVGGEFTSGVPMDDILGDDFGEILSQISASNMTFIGPNMPDLNNEDYAVDVQSILKRMGYRIYVSKLETQYNFGDNTLGLTLSWKNDGNAGFFFEWPVVLSVYNGNKDLIYWETLDLDLRLLNSGSEIAVSTVIPYTDEIGEEYFVGITIQDPLYDKNTAKMAIKMEKDEGWIGSSRIIYHYKK